MWDLYKKFKPRKNREKFKPLDESLEAPRNDNRTIWQSHNDQFQIRIFKFVFFSSFPTFNRMFYYLQPSPIILSPFESQVLSQTHFHPPTSYDSHASLRPLFQKVPQLISQPPLPPNPHHLVFHTYLKQHPSIRVQMFLSVPFAGLLRSYKTISWRNTHVTSRIISRSPKYHAQVDAVFWLKTTTKSLVSLLQKLKPLLMGIVQWKFFKLNFHCNETFTRGLSKE